MLRGKIRFDRLPFTKKFVIGAPLKMTENDEKLAEELATKEYGQDWRSVAINAELSSGAIGFHNGVLAGIAHQKKKTEGLESLLTAIRYAMSADGIKDETFYLNLKSAIDQTLREYETSK